MDHLEQLRRRIRQILFIVFAIENLCIIGIWWIGTHIVTIPTILLLIGSIACGLILTTLIIFSTSTYIMQPIQALWQVVLHLSPTQHGIAAPKMNDVHLGKEVVNTLATQIYQLTDAAAKSEAAHVVESSDISRSFVAQNLPLPLYVLDPNQNIIYANEEAAKYIGMTKSELVGKNIYMVLDMSFPSEDTLDTWLKEVKEHSATAVKCWERVRLNVRDSHPTLLFDLAAYYNKDNANKYETMLVLFDHTTQYSQDDQAVSYVALSVHELRTPLTLLRGYVEVFEDELTGKLNPELQDFMMKMKSTTQQLTAFVNNILNVARVDNDQLELSLQQGDWGTILNSTIESVTLRAKVRGITLETHIAPDLPQVGVDSLSIGEVINNLVDNAIKYSGSSQVIKIDAHTTSGGLIETTVQDFGLGIPSSILQNLFTKYYRDHRNRAQVGGTGLGLYLSKAIVTAHGGNLWVRSKEGEGSIFGFTLLPYTQLAEELKKNGNQEIVRGAHGWIKNHSLYRK
jgi:signal transduction histidine kinase